MNKTEVVNKIMGTCFLAGVPLLILGLATPNMAAVNMAEAMLTIAWISVLRQVAILYKKKKEQENTK